MRRRLIVVGNKPFFVLVRAFFEQFFSSESVTSDIQLRQTIIWVLAFLVTPGAVFVIQMYPFFQFIVRRSRIVHQPEMVDEALVLFGVLFVTYAMVAIGLVAAFVWDALSFDQRDAMVLGPQPLRGSTIISAKLAALALLLLGGSLIVTLVTAVPFAQIVGDQLGAAAMIRVFAAHLAAANLAALCVFAAIVAVRGSVALALGARASAAVGSLLQFLFVGALLSFFVLMPAATAAAQTIMRRGTGPSWLPGIWFVGVFESIRGSSRTEFTSLSGDALAATAFAVAAAVAVSIAGYRRQLQRALAPGGSAGALGGARLSRAVAHAFAGRGPVARATVDFILLTIARNRSQQAPIAMNAAIALAFIVGGLTRVRSLDELMRPRSAVMWMPLLLVYWATVGIRASFFVPVDLPAAWSFRFHAPEPATAYWTAVKAAIIGFVLPAAVLITIGLTAPVAGWHVAAWHAAIVGAVSIVLAEIAALTVDFVPFTRAYEPGHAKLKTRWPFYLGGVFMFCWLPSRFVLWWPDDPIRLGAALAGLASIAIGLDRLGRRRARRWSISPPEDADQEYSSVIVLNVGFQGYRV
jgi:hypothetical protein